MLARRAARRRRIAEEQESRRAAKAERQARVEAGALLRETFFAASLLSADDFPGLAAPPAPSLGDSPAREELRLAARRASKAIEDRRERERHNARCARAAAAWQRTLGEAERLMEDGAAFRRAFTAEADPILKHRTLRSACAHGRRMCLWDAAASQARLPSTLVLPTHHTRP